MSGVHLYLIVIYHLNEIQVSRENHDKKDTTLAYVPKLKYFGKITSFIAFLDQNWLGVSPWAALNVLSVPK